MLYVLGMGAMKTSPGEDKKKHLTSWVFQNVICNMIEFSPSMTGVLKIERAFW